MLRLTVLLLLACCSAISYPPYQNIISEMDRYVIQCRQEGLSGITARKVAMGNSTEGREMVAFCFGNCDRGQYAVAVLPMDNTVVSSNGRHPRA